jgi:hypothetical protein
MNKQSDLVVWNDDSGYDARLKVYPTNLGAPAFELPKVSMARTEASKKMLDVFEREQQELIERIKKLYDEYNTSVMVWESRISFEPTVGHTYYLYEFNNVRTLSLISPKEWNKYDYFLGAFTLTSDRKWLKQH